jgi:hypothetical protein
LSAIIFLGVVVACFCWGFGKNGRQNMVFWWSICGGMRGKRGGFATRFQGSKNTPRIPDLFFGLPDLGNGLVSREIIGRLSSSCLVFFSRLLQTTDESRCTCAFLVDRVQCWLFLSLAVFIELGIGRIFPDWGAIK